MDGDESVPGPVGPDIGTIREIHGGEAGEASVPLIVILLSESVAEVIDVVDGDESVTGSVGPDIIGASQHKAGKTCVPLILKDGCESGADEGDLVNANQPVSGPVSPNVGDAI